MTIIKYIIFVSITFSFPAWAYIGPGLGGGILLTIGLFVLSIIIALIALLIYPVKKILKKIKNKK